MSDNPYFYPGLAAIALAIVFPLYWFLEIGAGTGGSLPDIDMIANGLSPLDYMFLLVGGLNVYFYLSIRNVLYEHFHFKKIHTVLAIMVGICGFFYLGTFILDVLATAIGRDVASFGIAIVTVISIISFGVLDILMGFTLFRDGEEMSGLIRGFGLVSLIQGVMEVTIVFSGLALFVFPMSALIMAVYFLRKPEMVEVV